jgi:hypothetical protein
MPVLDAGVARPDPHSAPGRRGRAVCLFHDGEVIIPGWTDARISWPRCTLAEGDGRPSILVEEELARALRHEASLAIQYWWGADVLRVRRWKKALGTGPRDPEGSRWLYQGGG